MFNLKVQSRYGREFLREHFGDAQVVRVQRTRGMTNTQCYSNVRILVASEGGAVVLGWQLLEIPGRYVEAQHHAIWRSPAGTLEDVTAGTEADRRKSILFIPVADEVLGPFDPATPSIFKQLGKSELISRWIDGNILRMQLIGEVNSLARPQGPVLTTENRAAEIRALHLRIMTLTDELREVDRTITAQTMKRK